MRQMFLRLVTLGEGRQDTRRRVARSELDALEVDPEAVEDALDTFGRHRLLTFDREPTTREPTVEIAHESLLAAWGRLRGWVDDAREDLRQDRQLARAAAEWRGADRDPSFLLRGARLDHVEAWASATDLAIGRDERAYLKASGDRRVQERAEETARSEHEAEIERRSKGRLRALVAVFAVAALVAGSLTIVATNQSQRAGRAARTAQAQELAAAAIASASEDPERAVLLAMEAVRRTRTEDGSALPEAVDALHRAVVASRIVMTVPGVGSSVDWSPAGVIASEGGDGSGVVEIRSDVTGDRLFTFAAHEGDITGMEFSQDGSMLATTGVDGYLRVWDAANGDPISETDSHGTAADPSFSADGSMVAVSWGRGDTGQGSIRVIETMTGDRIRQIGRLHDPGRVAFSPDGQRMAFLSLVDPGQNMGRIMSIVDERGGETFVPFEVPVWVGTNSVRWSPDGRFLTGPDHPYVWDADTGERLFLVRGHIGDVTDVDWHPHLSRMVTAGYDASIRIWQIEESGYRLLMTLPSPSGGIDEVEYSPDGTRLLATSGGEMHVYWADPTLDAEVVNLKGEGDVAFVSGSRLLRVENDSLAAWNVDGGSGTAIGPHLSTLPSSVYWPTFEVSPDGRLVALEEQVPVGEEALLTVWDSETGRVRFARPGVDFLAWAPDSRSLAMERSSRIEIVDLGGRVIHSIANPDTRYYDAAFSADGRRLITAEDRGPGECISASVKVWEVAIGEKITTIEDCAFRVLVDPDGEWIVTATDVPKVWDADSGEQLGSYPAPPGSFVRDAALSPDGSTLAVVGNSDSVQLFDTETRSQELVLRGHACGVEQIVFNVDGSMLASSACDGVRVWALDIDDLMAIAQDNVTRSLTDAECRQYLHLDACPADQPTAS